VNVVQQLLARRYARAFFNVYGTMVVETDFEGLERARIFFVQHKNINFFMKLSSLDAAVKKSAVKVLLKDLGLSPIFSKVLSLLIDEKRTYFLPEFFYQLRNEFKKVKGVTEWKISSSQDLSEDDQKIIEAFLKKTSKNDIYCVYECNNALIAGVRMQSDELLWENSVRQRLQRIARFLAQ